MHVGRKKKKQSSGKDTKLPAVGPTSKCRLRVLREERIKDYLLLESEFIGNQEEMKPKEADDPNNEKEDERGKVDELRGSPMTVGSLEEIIDENHAIVSTV